MASCFCFKKPTYFLVVQSSAVLLNLGKPETSTGKLSLGVLKEFVDSLNYSNLIFEHIDTEWKYAPEFGT